MTLRNYSYSEEPYLWLIVLHTNPLLYSYIPGLNSVPVMNQQATLFVHVFCLDLLSNSLVGYVQSHGNSK